MEETGASGVRKMLKIVPKNSEVNPKPDIKTHKPRLGKLVTFGAVSRKNIQEYLFFNRCKPKLRTFRHFSVFQKIEQKC